MSQKSYTDYDNFAWFYNKYWSKRLIDQIYWTIEKYFLSLLPKGASILDICCGNGHLAARMAKSGFKVAGIEGSEPMLEYARKNAPSCTFSQADARDFSLEQKFDAAISTCDSLNHIMNIDELRMAFENIYASLKPDGLFSFDMNTEEGYHKYWTGEKYSHVADDNVFIICLQYDDERKQSSFDATMFRLIDGHWQRFDACLTQRFYPIDDILALLKTTGFVNIQHFDTEKDYGIDGTGRIMFVTQKW